MSTPEYPAPTLSVVICTRNRARGLAVTLDTLAASGGLAPGACEVVVVDNGSRDGMAGVVDAFARRAPFPVRLVAEPRIGLSHARNAGVAAARGALVAFTDDDVSVDEGWMRGIIAAFDRHPDAVVVGGRILPAWEGPVPDWLTPDLHPHLSLLDLGDRERRLDRARIWGANVAFRAGVFRAGRRFNPDRGQCGDKLFVGEETDLIDELIRQGDTVLYCPELVVFHRIGPERLRRAYFRRRQFDVGENTGRLGAGEPFRRLFGVPLWVFNIAARSAGRALFDLSSGRVPAMGCQLEFSFALGYLRGARSALRPGSAGAAVLAKR